MVLGILRFARWLAWQLGELEHPVECAPARITVISGSQRANS
jgi:hypothetical protein